MYALEIHKLNETELLRRAERERLAGKVRRARRAERRAARDSGGTNDEGPVSTDRNRFAHAA
ncbi:MULTISPECIES: hypothetical protein [unclassified Streptomyces]|uniref:hypothetical protein n=1 Tax=unclassified Streptomyces TaxID=2593676 RepID=UPI0036E584E3